MISSQKVAAKRTASIKNNLLEEVFIQNQDNMPRRYRKRQEKTFLYETLTRQMKKILSQASSRWGANVPFEDIQGYFSSEAINSWLEEHMRIGRTILRIAIGLSIINGENTITEDHILQAFEAYKRGTKEYMEEYKPGNVD